MSGGSRENADPVLIAALAAGNTVEAAAKAAGMSEATVYRRLADAGFRARLAEAREQAIELAVARLSDSAAFAASTLRALAESAESESVRLGACRLILEQSFRGRELLDQRDQIERIKRHLGLVDEPATTS